VPDDFEVTADQGIEIGGTVEACVLRSDQAISLHGGMSGKGKGRIECKGVLSARFLNEVEVYCSGDVLVQKEIMNAKVYSLGRVIIREGGIVGGEVVALKGILCQSAGSELGVKTMLIAGVHYDVREKVMGLNKERVRSTLRQQELMNRVGPLLVRALKAPAVDNRLRQEIFFLPFNLFI